MLREIIKNANIFFLLVNDFCEMFTLNFVQQFKNDILSLNDVGAGQGIN